MEFDLAKPVRRRDSGTVCLEGADPAATMRDEAVIAARNNAEWCDAVCRTHGLAGRFSAGLWVQPLPGPPYYPNVVTLSRSGGASQYAAIAALAATLPEAAAVKDSFGHLDLARLGFQPLFDAQWIWLDPPSADRPRSGSAASWARVETEPDLAHWETAWAAAGSPTDSRVFLGSLLSDRRIAILGINEGGEFVAGCMANRSPDAVGLTNFFGSAADRELYRAGAITEVARFAAGSPIVGYESGEALAAFVALGFRSTGSLRVWART